MVSVIIITALLCIMAVCACFMAHAEKEERYATENELKEVYEHEQKVAEIITDANKTKADAKTGDHSVDFNYMADKLHDYASK